MTEHVKHTKLSPSASHTGRRREGKHMNLDEALFITLVIVGATATVFALAALVADFFFPERPRPARPSHRPQATYRRAPK